MKKLFIILRQDFFKANNGLSSEPQIVNAGSLWIKLFLTEEEKSNYKFSIWPGNFLTA